MDAVRSWFPEFAKEHADRFFFDPADAARVLTWIDEFQRNNVTHEEADAASRWLLANEPPRSKMFHLAALMRRIREDRTGPGRHSPGTYPGSECTLCTGSAVVSVPDHRDMIDGQWGGVSTCVVACSCAAGQQMNAQRDRDKRFVTIDQYERKNPDWRQELEEGRERVSERCKRRKAEREGVAT